MLGILFKPEMIRAILAKQKTHTRRIIPVSTHFLTQCNFYGKHSGGGFWASDITDINLFPQYMAELSQFPGFPCRYGAPGTRFYAKERWRSVYIGDYVTKDHKYAGSTYEIVYAADRYHCQVDLGEDDAYKLSLSRFDNHPSMFMPEYAARIFGEVVDINPVRLLSITDEEATMEGFNNRAEFLAYYDALAKPGFKSITNPWVFDIEFKVLEVRL